MADYTLEPITEETKAYTLEPIKDSVPTEPTFQPLRDQSDNLWDRIASILPQDMPKIKARATNALVYSEMLGIRPDVAYTYHDEISQQIQDKMAGEKIVTSKVGLLGAATAGTKSSLAGMMAARQVPAPFESVDQWERWINGITAMGLDLPVYIAGYAIGGGTPITGTAGAFGFHAGLRQMLVDRYTKGEVGTAGELFERVKNAAYETAKGEVIGATVGAAGRFSPARFKLASEIATMTTTSKLIEGQLPTVQDFIDNAAMMLVLHSGIKGYDAVKSRVVRSRLQEAFVDSGIHPQKVAEGLAAKLPGERAADIMDEILNTSAAAKANNPGEKVETAKEAEPSKTEVAQDTGAPKIVKPDASSQAEAANVVTAGGAETQPFVGAIFSSPNIKNLNFEQASQRLSHPDQARAEAIVSDTNKRIGITARVYRALGDWVDGAENSVFQELTGITDYATIRYSAASQGLIFRQKTVIPFMVEEGGTHTVYKMSIPHENVAEIRQLLSENGLQFRTIVSPKDGTTTVAIYDAGYDIYNNINKVGEHYGIDIKVYKGRGEFLGSDTSRSAGAKAFTDVRRAFEESQVQKRAPGTEAGRGLHPASGREVSQDTPPAPSAKDKNLDLTQSKENITLPSEGDTTGIKKRMIDAERERLGLPPLERPMQAKVPEEDVHRLVDSGVIDTAHIIETTLNKAAGGERIALTDEQIMALNYRNAKLVKIEKELAKEISAKNKEGVDTTDLEKMHDDILVQIQDTQTVAGFASAGWGRSGLALQTEINNDFSVAGIIRKAQKAGANVDAEFRKEAAKKAREYEKLNKPEKEIAKETESTIEVLRNEEKHAQRKQQRSYKKEELQAEWDSTLKEFNKAISGLHAGVPLEGVPILIKLARIKIREGILVAEDIVDSIHTAITKMGIEYSKREIGVAIGGYGKKLELSKDPVDVELRRVKRELNLISGLEDVTTGKPVERTGLQRDLPSDKERKLSREIREVMKENGLISGESQWKTSLDAVKTKFKNLKEDLKRQIKDRKRDFKTTKKVEYDEEAKQLKSEVDELNKILTMVTSKPTEPMWRKVEKEIESLTKRLQTREEKIATGNIEAQKRGDGKPITPATEYLKGMIKEADSILREMRKHVKDTEIRLEDPRLIKWRKRLDKEYETLTKKLEERDTSKKERAEPLEIVIDEDLKRLYRQEQIKREVAKMIYKKKGEDRNFLEKIGWGAIEVNALVKALKSGMDLSGTGRQGFFALIGHPSQIIPAIKTSIAAFRSPEIAFAQDIARMKDPMYHLAKRGKTEFTEIGGTMAQMEEHFQSRLANNIPGIAASQRAYMTLNNTRLNLFKTIYESAKPSFKNGKATQAELEHIGMYVNEVTGRGSIKGLEGALTGLGTILWAPRLMLSRFQLLSGHALWSGGSAATKTAIAKEYARILTGLGVVYAFTSLWGDDVTVETDPRSSDFSKIKIGNNRIDPLAGVAQASVLVSRLWTGEKKSTAGRIMPLTGNVPFGGQNTWDVLTYFMRSKLSPVIGEVINLRQGEDIIGQKVTMYDIPERFLMPLTFGDIYDAMQENGVPAGAAFGMLSTFGIGLQVYDPRQRRQ